MSTFGTLCGGNPVAHAIWSACVMDIAALKPGNVSVYAPGHGMNPADFLVSAVRTAPLLGKPGLTLGERILFAVRATHGTVGCNTNLGIILLAAPLAHAAVTAARGSSLAQRLGPTLADTTVEDARLVFQAIRLASPAGLGEVRDHDVRTPPSVTLREAMAAAQHRDRIAYQYATDFLDIFGFGRRRLDWALARWRSEEWAAVAVYLGFLTRFGDTHIERKFGRQAALEVAGEAGEAEQALLACARPQQCMSLLLDFDVRLKSRGINPGTSADLTVATLLAARLDAWLTVSAETSLPSAGPAPHIDG